MLPNRRRERRLSPERQRPMTDPVDGGARGDKLPSFAIQLIDAYLYECTVTRREASEDDPTQPTFSTALKSTEAEEGTFMVHLQVDVAFRFRVEAVSVVSATTTGLFSRQGEVPPEIEERFRRRDAAVLLWPYARSIVGELSRMMDVGLPALPTIDVARLVEAPQEA